MSYKVNAVLFNRMIEESSRVAVSTHMNPDGDAVGSSCAIALYLKGRGKDVHIVIPDMVPENLDFAIDRETAGMIEHDVEKGKKFLLEADLVISTDYNNPDRAGDFAQAVKESKARKVLMDHHPNPATGFYDIVFSRETVSSACEVVYWLLLEMPGIDRAPAALGPEIGRLLMLGMTTDSNNFSNSTFPSTLRMAGGLLDAGVDRENILDGLYNNYRENRFRLMGYFLSSKLKITPDGVAYAVFSSKELKRFDIREGETEGFVNMPLGIDRVRMSVFIKEDADRLRVSVRSVKGVSANRCARMYFNGGGHENAAGGRLLVPGDIASVSEAESYVEKCCAGFFSDPDLWRSGENQEKRDMEFPERKTEKQL